MLQLFIQNHKVTKNRSICCPQIFKCLTTRLGNLFLHCNMALRISAMLVVVNLISAGKEVTRLIQDEVYDVMICHPELRLNVASTKTERNAWRLLKKFCVAEIICPISKKRRKCLVSLLPYFIFVTMVIHYLNFLNCY